MDNLQIDATKFTPQIFFDVTSQVLEIRGKSYPENTAEFYEPVFEWIKRYLVEIGNIPFTVNIQLDYFNSSSSKVLMDLFDLLDNKAREMSEVTINWYYDEEDDIFLEHGEEFQEDLDFVDFNLIEFKS
ncbi:MAG: hypothetical protein COB67_10800 [SAR324 cluster bacterium]|uniref:SiaC family regulatory phosphoprotein domain-containing protein n=1 Tax=SAR324 cluster bacterium TaxID=2024889 RepID=A0A2A4SW72_9DELT|nr:MAG: hypothetical protein COB67_10800 [SAR324 cluster bacterium]